MTPITFVISLSLLILCASAADLQCGAGELICDDARMGPRCYDPNTYTCPSGSRGSILCGNQEHGPDGACGFTCYDMVDYVCCNEQLYNAYDNSAPCAPTPTSAATIPPPQDSIMCGTERCLALYQCCNDTRMGPTCFDPNGASCPVGSQGPVLCGFQKNGADAACGTTCYDFHEYQCCNDQIYGIDENTPCSTGVTSAPTQVPTSLPSTVAPTNAPTNAPTTAPTSAPTNAPTPATESPTSAGTIAPSPDSIMCGGERCLALYECCNDTRLGPTCFDPNGASCPVGSQGPVLCGFQKNGADAACGTICYDFHEYQCCNDQLYGMDEDTPCVPSGTAAPTQVATSMPTNAPTQAPTTAPTQAPTQASTQAPTNAPTSAPTNSPTSVATIPPPSDSIMCGEERCLALYECCNDTRMGPKCFDPNGASCPVGSQGPVLCGFQKNGADAACGTTCYDFHEYQCCNDQLYGIDEITACSANPTGAPTSPPASEMCGSSKCQSGYNCCNDVGLGPTCFDPTIYSCPVGSQGPILCGFQEHGADGTCGSVCFDMVDYKCCNDELYGADDEDAPC